MATAIFTSAYFQAPGSRCLVRTSSGNLYVGLGVSLVAPEDDAYIRVWYGGSDGSSWTQKDSGNAPRCHARVGFGCAIDDSGVMHFVYRDETNADEFNYITFDTATDTFDSESANILTSPQDPTFPANTSVAVDGNGKVHAVVKGADKTGPTTYETIYYTNNVGGSWAAKVEIDGDKNLRNCEVPNIAINNSDLPVVVYDFGGILAAKGNQNNATSFTLAGVDNSITLAAPLAWDAPSIAVDGNGDVWMGYAGSFGATAKIAKQSADWTSAWSIFDTGEISSWMVSGVPHGGDIHVFYDHSSDIIHNKYDPDGAAWEGETVLFSAGVNDVVSARWSKHNNPSYITYGMDLVFLRDTFTDLYYENYSVAGGQIMRAQII